MTLPVESSIERRLLLNFRADPTIVAALLPEGFRPLVVRGWAVVGICMLRLTRIRPAGSPRWVGLSSENAAHRIAVEWCTDRRVEVGVFVPRRDTSSTVGALLGGRLLDGVLQKSRFHVEDRRDYFSAQVIGKDGLLVEVVAHEAGSFHSELFDDVDEASEFFQRGCVAFSPNLRRRAIEGVALESPAWAGVGVDVETIRSSVLSDESLFPRGAVTFDSALMVRDLAVTWRPAGDRPSTSFSAVNTR